MKILKTSYVHNKFNYVFLYTYIIVNDTRHNLYKKHSRQKNNVVKFTPVNNIIIKLSNDFNISSQNTQGSGRSLRARNSHFYNKIVLL